MSFVEALKIEIAGLERELEADPNYAKLREARRLLSMYQATPAHDVTPYTTAPSVPPQRRAAPTSGKSATIIDVVKQRIGSRTAPTPTREIMAMLEEEGIDVGGSAPQNTVSSLFSKADEFISHGRSGWTLRVPNDHERVKADDEDPERDASSALFENRPSQPVDFPAQGREAGPGGGT